MKKVLIILMAIALLASGCTGQEAQAEENSAKTVKVMTLESATENLTLDYYGVVTMEKVNKVAFKSSGTIETVPVEIGDYVEAGTVLASLDTTELELALDMAGAQVNAADAQYEKAQNGAAPEDIEKAALNVTKAQDAYDYSVTNFARAEELYADEIISQSDYESAQLEVNVRASDLKQAEEVYNQAVNGTRYEDLDALSAQAAQAEANYALKKTAVDEAVLVAPISGYVLDVLYEPGEIIAAGYPVVVVGSSEKMVKVGVSAKDLDQITPGMTAEIEANDSVSTATVAYISDMPDSTTHTFEVGLNVSGDAFSTGDVVTAKFIVDEVTGIWVPLTAIVSGTTDYVFINRDGIAEKTDISFEKVVGTQVLATNLEDNSQLIVDGIKNLYPGDSLNVVE
jgi:multidrug efflux pump subunit AcrA (membrane-fusion protein)